MRFDRTTKAENYEKTWRVTKITLPLHPLGDLKPKHFGHSGGNHCILVSNDSAAIFLKITKQTATTDGL